MCMFAIHNTLQHTATHRNTLQHTATHCNNLQHTATHCIRYTHAPLTPTRGSPPVHTHINTYIERTRTLHREHAHYTHTVCVYIYTHNICAYLHTYFHVYLHTQSVCIHAQNVCICPTHTMPVQPHTVYVCKSTHKVHAQFSCVSTFTTIVTHKYSCESTHHVCVSPAYTMHAHLHTVRVCVSTHNLLHTQYSCVSISTTQISVCIYMHNACVFTQYMC